MCDKLQQFEKTNVALEYKVSDIVKMLTLFQNFVSTYDQEAANTREQINKLQADVGESKLMGTCLEQKVHYIDREVTKLESLTQMPRAANANKETMTISEGDE